MNLTWVLVVLFLGDPAPRPPMVMPVPALGMAGCQAIQGVIDQMTKAGDTAMPPHISWCVQWPKDVPAPVVKP